MPSHRLERLTRRHALLAAAVGTGTAMGLPSEARAAVSSTGIDLMDFGATGDGAADDGPALQAALRALADRGGGNLHVPRGRYAIKTPVHQSFGSRAPAIALTGDGSASQFLLKTGAGSTALAISDLHRLVVENVTFVGTVGIYPDVHRGLYIGSCLLAIVRDCEFYGIAATGTGGAVLYSYSTELRLHDSAFWGCTGNSSRHVPVLENEEWIGLTVENSIFWDNGYLAGVLYSKTGTANPYAWVALGEPRRITGSASQREVRLIKVSMDEGAYRGLEVWPFGSVRPLHIYLDDVQVNGFDGSGGIGASIKAAETVTMERCWFGHTRSSTKAVRLVGVGAATLANIRCAGAMTTIEAVWGTRALTIIDSVYETLDSAATVTNVLAEGRYTSPLSLANTVVPSKTPTVGGHLFVEDGALKWLGARGTVTTIAPS